MVLLAIVFWFLIAMAVLGAVISLVEIIKGKKHPSGIDSLPKPIRKALGHWF